MAQIFVGHQYATSCHSSGAYNFDVDPISVKRCAPLVQPDSSFRDYHSVTCVGSVQERHVYLWQT